VIAKHWIVVGEKYHAIRLDGVTPWDAPEGEAVRAAVQDAYKREREHLLQVLTVQPTTLAGVQAVLNYLGQDEFLNFGEDGFSDETVLSAWSNCDYEEITEAAKAFPARLAATMRSLIGEVRS
jgi:hypothetical protein